MKNIIVSDIFGRTEALDELASNFSVRTEIHDPYNAKNMAFSSEQQAYDFFTQHTSLEQYTKSLLKRIQSANSPVNLIGFSVGASAIWNISHHSTLNNVMKACCYYGSQIRNHLHIEPLFPITLTFPISETHFSVTELMNKLNDTINVTVRQVSFLHGFMNSHSVNYNQEGYWSEILALSKM
ncbi:MAG: dienelactone hydrolase family protein [Paraglaciecola sp.]|uniref:dienelactone hydrolase family protein n=1 Tax=Paraglaciecola sp. TaxID=1920173 RepID=UPI0032982A55